MAVVTTLRKGVALFFVGALMGACDLVPGVSGSSMAYVCGVYERLVVAVSSPKSHLSFLLPLVFGMCVSVVTLVMPLHYGMQNMLLRSLLFCFFIGLSLMCAMRAFLRAQGGLAFLLLGAMSSVALSLIPIQELSVIHAAWLLPAGLLSGIAMLLPAISGAQILYLLGLYPLVIEHFAHFVATGNQASLHALVLLGVGVLGGIFIASKLMHVLFKCFAEKIHGFFAGFITMALPKLWPFEEMILGDMSYWVALIALGFGILFGSALNWFANSRTVHASS